MLFFLLQLKKGRHSHCCASRDLVSNGNHGNLPLINMARVFVNRLDGYVGKAILKVAPERDCGVYKVLYLIFLLLDSEWEVDRSG